jgi:predicted membrane-bound spermidine synthase
MKKFWVFRFNKYQLVALVTGAVLMTYELVASRLLAPTIGSSTFVWTNVIGVIIAAMSIGYWLGGVLADKYRRESDIVFLCLGIALGITTTLTFYGTALEVIANSISDARWQGLVASLLLFAPTSMLLGMVSPYLAKFAVTSTKSTGREVASLSALNAIGSIIGTFLTGFVLFGVLGSKAILLTLVLVTLATSWLIVPRKYLALRLVITGVFALLAVLPVIPKSSDEIVIDTLSASYVVRRMPWGSGGEEVIGLVTGPLGTQSATYVRKSQKDLLVVWYSNRMVETVANSGVKPENILVIGGGAFSMPEWLARQYPSAQIDVVEIDGELPKIAEEYFDFEHLENIEIFIEDARTFVAKSDKRYDAVLLDAFGDGFIPWQLMTGEFGRDLSRTVADDGVLIANTILGTEGACRPLYEATHSALGVGFSHAYIRRNALMSTTLANTIFVYSQNALEVGNGMNSLDGFAEIAMSRAAPYTDDFAPIEQIQQSCLASRH